MQDCFTCRFARRDEYNKYVTICSGFGNCEYEKFEGTITYTIQKMTEKEFDEATMEVMNRMKKEYPSMTSGDLQTIVMFSKMFKEEYLK